MKRILNVLFIILLVILIKLIIMFSLNKIIINNYNKGNYNTTLIKALYILNINQPYIAYYNEGNILYKSNNYSEAIKKYNKALEKKIPQNKVCDVRINLSLSLIKNITSTDNDIIYNDLEKAKNNLYNNKCANKDDDYGYSKNAEKLEEEIKKIQEELNEDPDNNNNKDKKDKNNDNNKKEKEIEKELKKIEKKSNASRQIDLSAYENLDDFSYNTGKSW